MEGVAAQRRVVLQLLDLLLLGLLVAGRHVARRVFLLFTGFGALEDDDFAGHSCKVLRGFLIGSPSHRAR